MNKQELPHGRGLYGSATHRSRPRPGRRRPVAQIFFDINDIPLLLKLLLDLPTPVVQVRWLPSRYESSLLLRYKCSMATVVVSCIGVFRSTRANALDCQFILSSACLHRFTSTCYGEPPIRTRSKNFQNILPHTWWNRTTYSNSCSTPIKAEEPRSSLYSILPHITLYVLY